MTIAIGTYLRFQDRTGVDVGFNFQNFFYNESRVYNGVTYTFANFGFSGSSTDLTAANISASLVFAQSLLPSNIVKSACDKYWIVNIRTVWLNPDTLAETSDYLEEYYSAVSFEHDLSRLVLTLGSPMDAVRSEVPQRVLTQELVGSLPTTGAINIR